MTATFERIKIDRIAPHQRNVRQDLGDLTELAASIKGIGVLQPLTVAPVLDGEADFEKYTVIAGHRRLAAAKDAGVESIPCIVRDDLDTLAKQLEAMLVENLQRTDLTVMEEADAYQQLELLGATEVSIAKATGRSRGTVRQRLALAGLPTERRDEFEKGTLSLDGAVKCARLREKWADDSEILAFIDGAATYMFASGSYGVDARIERILEDRKPKPEQDEEGDEDAPTLKREDWEKQRQADQEKREILHAARAAGAARMYDWLSGRIATKDDTVARALIALAIEDVIDEYSIDRALPIVGIEPCGEDEDVDDANLRITKAAKELSGTDQMVLLALAVTDIAVTATYNYGDHLERMQSIGYSPTSADRAAIGGE